VNVGESAEPLAEAVTKSTLLHGLPGKRQVVGQPDTIGVLVTASAMSREIVWHF